MNAQVAMKRGLSMAHARDINAAHYQGPEPEFGSNPEKSSRQPMLYQRNSLVRMEDRRFADASISHDGDYAFAICHALDEPFNQGSEPLTDNGHGDPIHEPEYGDRGFVSG